MSTKIWTAWRFPATRINEFIDIVRPQMFERVIADVRSLADDVKPEFIADKMADWTEKSPFSREDTEFGYRVGVVLDTWKDPKIRRSILSIECGLSIFLHQSKAYVIPWGSAPYTNNLVLPDWAEDYAYWNNTDRPEGISQRAWNARGRTWDKAALSHWTTRRMTVTVVSMDPLDLSRAEIELHFLREAGERKRQAQAG